MQVSSIKPIKNNMNLHLTLKRDLQNKRKLYLIGALIIVFSILYLTVGVNFEHVDYAMSQRIPKLIAIILTGGCIAFSSVIFQTITNNNILTPSVLGLDSLYILIQTMLVFFIGMNSKFMTSKNHNFLLSVTIMVIASFVLYKKLFEKSNNNIFFLLLIGMIFGTLFKSISTFMQVMIDPNEYASLQNSLYASFGNVNTDIITMAIIMIVIMFPFICDDLKYLDVIGLGKEHAINLGVDYDKVVKKMIVVVSILVSISTALVGPLTFLGLLVVNITKQLLSTYKHLYIIICSVLVSIVTLVGGQLLVEHVFTFETTLSVIINFVGGIYFIYLLLKESRV